MRKKYAFLYQQYPFCFPSDQQAGLTFAIPQDQDNTPSMPLVEAHLGGFLFLGMTYF